MDVFEVMRTQPSTKKFKPDLVSDDDIKKILTAATWAPNGANAQPWEFIVIKDPEMKKKVSEIYGEGWDFLRAHPRRINRIEYDERIGKKTMTSRSQYLRDHLEESPVLIVVAMNKIKNNYPKDGILKSFRAEVNYTSTMPCIQNLMLAARALGLGTCLTTALNILEEDAKIALGMPEETQIIALIPLGYPVNDFRDAMRIPAEEFTHHDRWQKKE